MSELALEMRDLVVGRPARPILQIRSLSLGRREFLAVLGPNGAGKTTLLRSCLGLQRHVRGEVTVLDRPVYGPGAARPGLGGRIGYVPQLLTVAGEMPLTVREVVPIGRAGLAGLGRRLRRQDWQAVDGWIDRLGLSSLAQQRYCDVSGGEQRKTLIARAMAQQPSLLLLDEPTANLDLGWRERLVETVAELYRQWDLAVVLVCHELEVLPPCCGRIVLLESGRLAGDGPPDRVLDDGLIARLYGEGLALLSRGGRLAVVPQGEVS